VSATLTLLFALALLVTLSIAACHSGDAVCDPRITRCE